MPEAQAAWTCIPAMSDVSVAQRVLTDFSIAEHVDESLCIAAGCQGPRLARTRRSKGEEFDAHRICYPGIEAVRVEDTSEEERHFTTPGGDTYRGRCDEKGKPHGFGVWEFAKGGSYEGFFKRNKRHGQGTMWYRDGSKYEGRWEDGQRHGAQGMFSNPDGRQYRGGWRKGKKHGKGEEFDREDGVWYSVRYEKDDLKERTASRCFSESTWRGTRLDVASSEVSVLGEQAEAAPITPHSVHRNESLRSRAPSSSSPPESTLLQRHELPWTNESVSDGGIEEDVVVDPCVCPVGSAFQPDHGSSTESIPRPDLDDSEHPWRRGADQTKCKEALQQSLRRTSQEADGMQDVLDNIMGYL